MFISNVFSARNVTLVVFILVVLFLGATFDLHVGPGPESFVEGGATAATAAAQTAQKKTALSS